MSDPMTAERIAKLRAAAKFMHNRTPEEQALIDSDASYAGLDLGDVAGDLLDALDEIERLRAEPLVVYAITFDQDTFGIFRTREAAEGDLKRQIANGGPAWDDCKVEKWTVRDD